MPLRLVPVFLCLLVTAATARAQVVTRDIPYAEHGHERQVLDIYAPPNAKDLPVVFWIHGGGWQTGDKSDVQLKPQAFMDEGFVFVSTNYRLLPNVDMGTLIRDVAKSFALGARPHRRVWRRSEARARQGAFRGRQLAAIICTDDRYLKAEGVSLRSINGCVPVDGDTYDVPAIIETAETRLRVHGFPPPKYGHREKFGNDPENHKTSPPSRMSRNKHIPPFLILHVADHPDTSAQARRFGAVLKDAGMSTAIMRRPGYLACGHQRQHRQARRPRFGCGVRLREDGAGTVISCRVMTPSLLVVLGALAVTTAAQAPMPAPEVQIAGAVQAAPADQRESATVIASMRRASTRPCARAPATWSASPTIPAKTSSTWPATTRISSRHGARPELAALGRRDVAPRTSLEGIQAGTLGCRRSRGTPIVQGSAFDATAGTVADSYTRWVIYTPGATPE